VIVGLWRLWVFMLWFGVMMSVGTVIIGVALLFAIGAVIYGLASPTRTVGGQLRSLYVNTEAGIAHVRAMRG
jgi:hypothetical protein